MYTIAVVHQLRFMQPDLLHKNDEDLLLFTKASNI